LSRKTIIFWAVIAGAAAAAAHRLLFPLMPSDAPGDRVAQATRDAAEPSWTALPKRKTMGEPAGQLFFPPWTPPPQSGQPLHTPAAVSKPAPRPMPYRVAGKVFLEGLPQIVLAKGDSIVTVREGDTLEDGYRVEAIHREHLTLLYLPLGVREELPVTWTFTIDEPLAEAAPEPASGAQSAAGASRDPTP
jgi:hypothetical protein